MEGFNSNLTAAMKDAGAVSADLWQVAPDRLRVLEGFNARRVGYSTAQYVDGLLALAGAPLPIRKMVIESVISATTAIEAIKKHGDKATDVLLAAVVKAGGRRVTAKAMPGADFKKAVKKAAPVFYDTLTKVRADPGFQYLARDLQKALVDLMAGIKKPDDPKQK